MNVYTVEFRIESMTLSPEEVSQALGLLPCLMKNLLKNKIR